MKRGKKGGGYVRKNKTSRRITYEKRKKGYWVCKEEQNKQEIHILKVKIRILGMKEEEKPAKKSQG